MNKQNLERCVLVVVSKRQQATRASSRPPPHTLVFSSDILVIRINALTRLLELLEKRERLLVLVNVVDSHSLELDWYLLGGLSHNRLQRGGREQLLPTEISPVTLEEKAVHAAVKEGAANRLFVHVLTRELEGGESSREGVQLGDLSE